MTTISIAAVDKSRCAFARKKIGTPTAAAADFSGCPCPVAHAGEEIVVLNDTYERVQTVPTFGAVRSSQLVQ